METLKIELRLNDQTLNIYLHFDAIRMLNKSIIR